jgi:hypothetical protein
MVGWKAFSVEPTERAACSRMHWRRLGEPTHDQAKPSTHDAMVSQACTCSAAARRLAACCAWASLQDSVAAHE